MNQLWLEKYRPTTVKELVGIKKNLEELIAWCNKFVDGNFSREKAVALYGEAGTGKTTTPYIIAEEYGWDIIEINASDVRTHDDIINQLREATQSSSLINPKAFRIILIDEVDKLYTNEGRKDKSAERAIFSLMEKSNHPIIMTCNNIFDVPYLIKSECLQLQYKKMNARTRLKLLKDIAAKEDCEPGIEILNQINKEIRDTRTCINTLQVYCQTGVLYIPEVEKEVSTFEMTSTILDGKNSFENLDIIQKAKISPNDAILWIDENIGRKYTGIDLFMGYEALSNADIFLQRAFITQNYNNWKIANTLMSTGVSLSKTIVEEEKRFVKTEFPSYIKKLSQSKMTRGIKDSIAGKLSPDLHCSKKKFIDEMFTLIQDKAQFDLAWLRKLTSTYKLNELELALLLDTDKKDVRIKECIDASHVDAETEALLKRKDNKGMSLFDFA